MKSVKPGRGPSMMSGVVGIFMVIVGFAWTFGAMSMGAPVFFWIFGLAWTGIAIVNMIYSFKNATGKNRYSSYDIVDAREEPDPLNQRFGMQDYESDREKMTISENEFCPFCGAKVYDSFEFCNKCGKKLP